jgi:hypothetical protein
VVVVAVGAAEVAATAAVGAVDLGVHAPDGRLGALVAPDQLRDAELLGLLALVHPLEGALEILDADELVLAVVALAGEELPAVVLDVDELALALVVVCRVRLDVLALPLLLRPLLQRPLDSN